MTSSFASLSFLPYQEGEREEVVTGKFITKVVPVSSDSSFVFVSKLIVPPSFVIIS
jgi:hypothetical protein